MIFRIWHTKPTDNTLKGGKTTHYQICHPDFPAPHWRALLVICLAPDTNLALIQSYERISLCKLYLLTLWGKMNTSAICQSEGLCTFHILFAEGGVQSGRDRGYVRARRQPSSFLGDENETYTKIIEEMASFQLYNFVPPLPHLTYAVDFPSSSYDSRLMQLHSQGAKYRLVLPHKLYNLCPSSLHLSHNESY